jgi:metal-responsive CopG/Arc/MetJ family transcriptional regulator
MPRKRGLNKSKVGFSIDKNIQKEFEEYCISNMKNKSAIVNDLLRRFLKNSKINVETDNMEL